MSQKQALVTTMMKFSSMKGGNLLAFCSKKTNGKLNLCVHSAVMYDVENQVKCCLKQLNTSVE
jgi:hypothetical protein